MQWRHEKPNKVPAQLPLQPQSVGGLELRRGPAQLWAATSTRTRCSRTTGRPESASTMNAPPFDDRATRGGPGAYRNAQRSMWWYLSERRAAAGVGRRQHVPLDRRARHHLPRPQPRGDVPAVVVPERQRRAEPHAEHRRVAVDRSEDDGHYVFGLTRSADRRSDHAGQLHACRRAVDADLRTAVRVGRRLLELQGACRRPHEVIRRSLRAVRLQSNPDFNYRSFRTTNVLRWEYRPGSTLFVVWQQGREATLDHGTFDFTARPRRRLRRAGDQRVPREVGVLVEFLVSSEGLALGLPDTRPRSTAAPARFRLRRSYGERATRLRREGGPVRGSLAPLARAVTRWQFVRQLLVRSRRQLPPSAYNSRARSSSPTTCSTSSGGERTRASGPKPRIQLRSAGSFETWSTRVTLPSGPILGLLRRVPRRAP